MIKILFLASNPEDIQPLQLDIEMRAIDQALRLAEHRDHFDLRQHWAVQINDLQELMLRHRPHIVHFSGHGIASGEIVLQSADHKARIVSPDALSDLFGILQDDVRCVILNACDSEAQANAIAEHVDCVIGMSDAINDEVARNFSAALYRAFAYGCSVHTAFKMACNSIDLTDLPQSDIPRLLALHADPAEIFLIDRQKVSAQSNDAILQEIRSRTSGPEDSATPKPLLPRILRATHFTGRTAQLERLHQELQLDQMVALCGPGGIGKTALALEAVYGMMDHPNQPPARFPEGVLFHSFYDEPETDLALLNLLRQLGHQVQPPVAENAQRILRDRQLLLILDGAEDAEDLPGVLAVRGNCGVLITTRQREDALDATLLNVKPLPDEEAVQLLHRLVDQDNCTPEQAGAICQRIGYLPLAVQLIGRYMVKSGLRGDEVLHWLRQTPLEALSQGKRRMQSVPLLLTQSLAQVSETAHHALALIGRLAMTSINSSLLAPALEQEAHQMPHLLGELFNYHLLRRDAQGRYAVTHALIHTYAARRMALPDDSLERLGTTYADFAEAQSERGLVGYENLDQERVHLLTLAQACADARLWSVVNRLVSSAHVYLNMQGHWVQRKQFLKLGVQAARELPDHQAEGTHLRNLGSTYYSLGKKEEAIDYYQQAVVTARKIGNRKDEGAAVGNLGNIHRSSGRVEEGTDYYQRALIIAQDVGDIEQEGMWLGSLGNAYGSLGRIEESIDYYQQALTIAKEIGNRSNEGQSLANLGSAYFSLGRIEESIDYYQQALTIAKEIGRRSNEGQCLGNLGNAYFSLGRIEESIDYYQQALIIFREIGGRNTEGVFLMNSGRAHAILGNGAKAIKLCQQALTILQETRNRLYEGAALNYLGHAHGVVGQWAEAIERCHQAIAIQEEIGDRRSLSDSWNDLGEAYVACEQWTEAETAFEQALTLAQEVGNRHGEAVCQWNRGLFYEQQGDIAAAVAAMRVCVDYFQEIGHVEAEERAGRLAGLETRKNQQK